ncbi:NADH-quinone oxidoreductase subunit C [Campylobacter sp. faydin G-105]|uniref:NADH-quinone oxidoreductase subunit C n=1 Tax=Campylobacter anatolicus TaxID=2829105 RepID=UPI001B9DEC3A|nr:NADH-quinone oxidoreductase subunit C [Campylobacter anatolicus]MBR8462316.1 NADH-quinone oxidoreductase subunit C [Campylobacter anatolicus]
MRKFINRTDASKKQYYHNKFDVAKQTQRLPASESSFKDELEVLKNSDINVMDSYIELDQLIVFVNSNDNFKTLKALKKFGYEQLNEVGAIDLIADRGGYEIFYQLLSITHNRRMRLKCFVLQREMLKSVCEIYKSANWAEREMYDMSGVLIKDHPNLKRLIMPDDWFSHPLLKSYPLVGDEAAAWYEVDKIFGYERRDEIGAENRDPAYIEPKDTFNFSRICHEVSLGEMPKDEKSLQEYQESGGIKFVKRAKRDANEILKERP